MAYLTCVQPSKIRAWHVAFLLFLLLGCAPHTQKIHRDEISVLDADSTIAATDFFRDLFNTDSTIYGDYLVSTPFDIDTLKGYLSHFDKHIVKQEPYTVIDEYWKNDMNFEVCWKENNTYTIRYGWLTKGDVSLRNGLRIGCSKVDCGSLFNCKIIRDTVFLVDESGSSQITCYFNDEKLSILEFACFE